MRKIYALIISVSLLAGLLACVPGEVSPQESFDPVEVTLQALDATATAQHTQELPSPEPSATPTVIILSPTTLPTATESPTPKPTTIAFQGFLEQFRLYRAWWLDGKTYFYFLNAGIDFTMFATADDFDLVCEQDPANLTGMICVAESKIEEDEMDFVFYLDQEHEIVVHEASFNAQLMDNIVYHHQFDCPDRGKNVSCESEYRLYDGRCYYAHTCYDACGLYYSRDNLPKVYREFQGFTGPCN